MKIEERQRIERHRDLQVQRNTDLKSKLLRPSRKIRSLDKWDAFYTLTAEIFHRDKRNPRVNPVELLQVENERLESRATLVDQIIGIPPKWMNFESEDNPLAVNPHFPWWVECEWTEWHFEEFKKWRVATVLGDGTVLKAFDLNGLLYLRRIVSRVYPLMNDLGLHCASWYGNRGRKWVGGCSPYCEQGDFVLHPGISITTIHLDDTDLFRTYEGIRTALHELAHTLDRPAACGPMGTPHDEIFRSNYGAILLYYLPGFRS